MQSNIWPEPLPEHRTFPHGAQMNPLNPQSPRVHVQRKYRRTQRREIEVNLIDYRVKRDCWRNV